MHTAALIVAAGMSSRMGDFKPMLNIGSISIAQRVVSTFQQAGIKNIVMVTGFRADVLERHLAGNDIVFLRNEQFETTQMFESVCIGLSYLKNKCSRVLFTPVDIPLFTADTVKVLLKSDAKIASPVCDGVAGHPTLISSDLFDSILSDNGTDGLRGALQRCGEKHTRVPVLDHGILHDADTPEDYQALLDYHNKQLVRPVIKVSLSREMPFFDHRTAMLLRLVEETGSVRTACQRIRISYSSGWKTINTLESQLKDPLISRTPGGVGGGKSELTSVGRMLLTQYESFTQEIQDYSIKLFRTYFHGLF